MKITKKSEHVKVDGHRGRWYVIAESWHNSKRVFLLEHERYGDEAACVIVDEAGRLILDEVWNGFEDLYD